MPAPYLPLGCTLGFLSVVLFLLTVFLCVILLVLVMVSAIIIFQSDSEKARRKRASHLAAQTFHAEPSRSALPTRHEVTNPGLAAHAASTTRGVPHAQRPWQPPQAQRRGLQPAPCPPAPHGRGPATTGGCSGRARARSPRPGGNP